MDHTHPRKLVLLCWLALFVSIVLEVGATTLMKGSQGQGLLWESAGMVGMFALLGFSYVMLSKATLVLPIAVAFACWEGLGLVLVTLSSVFVLDEAMSLQRLVALAAVLAGVVLINYGTGHGPIKTSAKAGAA